jgi:DNA (cytosine-5)-methyltransferase 1
LENLPSRINSDDQKVAASQKEKAMKHIDLFSGIGGFAIAVETVWGKDVTHIFCDNDKFCQQVLKKHWPEARVVEDIRAFTNAAIAQPVLAELQAGGRIARGEDLTILTGGFPCQPFSNAGRKRGDQDDRYLWPEMLRVIREQKPDWVVGENVAGIINMALDQVCADLEGEGYEVRPVVLPAAALNAPHRRDRVWIIASRTGSRRARGSAGIQAEEGLEARPKMPGKLAGRPQRPHRLDAQNPGRKRSGGRRDGNTPGSGWQVQDARPDWTRDWAEIAGELCRVDDGLPVRLDGFELSKPAHRAQRLKSLGNAIVPQVAEEIFKAIKIIHERETD